MLKSITKPADIDYVMIEEDPEEREDFIALLESRFFFLAADARSTLRLLIYSVYKSGLVCCNDWVPSLEKWLSEF